MIQKLRNNFSSLWTTMFLEKPLEISGATKSWSQWQINKILLNTLYYQTLKDVNPLLKDVVTIESKKVDIKIKKAEFFRQAKLNLGKTLMYECYSGNKHENKVKLS